MARRPRRSARIKGAKTGPSPAKKIKKERPAKKTPSSSSHRLVADNDDDYDEEEEHPGKEPLIHSIDNSHFIKDEKVKPQPSKTITKGQYVTKIVEKKPLPARGPPGSPPPLPQPREAVESKKRRVKRKLELTPPGREPPKKKKVKQEHPARQRVAVNDGGRVTELPHSYPVKIKAPTPRVSQKIRDIMAGMAADIERGVDPHTGDRGRAPGTVDILTRPTDDDSPISENVRRNAPSTDLFARPSTSRTSDDELYISENVRRNAPNTDFFARPSTSSAADDFGAIKPEPDSFSTPPSRRASFSLPSTPVSTFENIKPLVEAERDDLPYKLVEFKRRTVKKYGVEEINYKVRFSAEWAGKTLESIQAEIELMFADLLEQIRQDHHGQDKVRVFIHNSNLKYNIPILIPLRFLQELDVESIMRIIMNVLNSNQHIALDDNLRVEIGILKMHRGGGDGKKIVRHGLDDPFNEKFTKRSVINIPTTDRMCAARAIAVAYARLMKHANYATIRHGKMNLQKMEALKLLNDVNLPSDREIEIGELCKFEDHLNVRIIVYNKPLAEGMLYAGQPEKEAKLFLYYSQFENGRGGGGGGGGGGHFDVISSMASFLAHKFYCQHCLLAYNNRAGHKCFMVCTTCHSDQCSIEQPLTCRLCQQEC